MIGEEAGAHSSGRHIVAHTGEWGLARIRAGRVGYSASPCSDPPNLPCLSASSGEYLKKYRENRENLGGRGEDWENDAEERGVVVDREQVVKQGQEVCFRIRVSRASALLFDQL